MIGACIFMMPALLAPYGGLSFGGWLITAGVSIMIALARLASRTTRTGDTAIAGMDPLAILSATAPPSNQWRSREGIAPKVLAKLSKGEAAWVSLVFSSALATGLLLLNYSCGLVGAFSFLIMMTTAVSLVCYLACALA